jgi:hypothetical protein
VPSDSLAFVAPAGFRKLPREFVADLGSIDRVDILAGHEHSLARAGRTMLLDGVLGALAGGFIGNRLGSFLGGMITQRNPDSEAITGRELYGFLGTWIVGSIGAVAGALGGGIDGARSHEKWQRVR